VVSPFHSASKQVILFFLLVLVYFILRKLCFLVNPFYTTSSQVSLDQDE
jgi:hypothetical protein